MRYKYLLMDGRARRSTDDAVVLEVCDSLVEAQITVPNHRGPAFDFDPVVVRATVYGRELKDLELLPETEQVPR